MSMSPSHQIADRLDRLRAALEGLGAPVWVQGSDREIPGPVSVRCAPGSQLSEWVAYLASSGLGWDARLKVAFGWSLLNIDEIADRLELGLAYGRDLAEDGVGGAWADDWLPVLEHNDGLVVADSADGVHRLWWESGSKSMGVDLAGLGELLVVLLVDGTYLWDAASGRFDLGDPEGHPVLDSL